MADSLQDIGSNTAVFTATPNWITRPQSGFPLPRYMTQYPGTVQSLISLTEDVPVSWQASYVTITRADEEEMLDFIHDHLGNAKRFWCIHPATFFNLKELASNGASIIKVTPNSFELMFRGYERIVFELQDGTLITRQVVDAVLDEDNDEIVLTLNTALDQDVDPSNLAFFGRIFLVRFDQTEFNQDVLGEYVSEWSLKFAELVGEYEDADL